MTWTSWLIQLKKRHTNSESFGRVWLSYLQLTEKQPTSGEYLLWSPVWQKGKDHTSNMKKRFFRGNLSLKTFINIFLCENGLVLRFNFPECREPLRFEPTIFLWAVKKSLSHWVRQNKCTKPLLQVLFIYNRCNFGMRHMTFLTIFGKLWGHLSRYIEVVSGFRWQIWLCQVP